MYLAPVLIFCYKRLDTLKQAIAALQKNELAKDTDLFIFSDGPKTEGDKITIEELRSYIKNVRGFKTVVVNESAINKGLANSIIDGVTEVLGQHNRVIVLEDDLLTSSNFLGYMNEALQCYERASKVFSISGYSFPISVKNNYPFDNYFTRRGSSWGWATWKDRWDKIDWNVNDYESFLQEKEKQRSFNIMGSDLSGMLRKQMEGKINSWAIRWVYHQFINDLFTVYPIKSKVRNIGFGVGATHTSQKFNRFDTHLDDTGKLNFNFKLDPELDEFFIKQFTSRFGVLQRTIYKTLNFFS
jgi:glycosyltransferase involved in cell wall biosynthesis